MGNGFYNIPAYAHIDNYSDKVVVRKGDWRVILCILCGAALLIYVLINPSILSKISSLFSSSSSSSSSSSTESKPDAAAFNTRVPPVEYIPVYL